MTTGNLDWQARLIAITAQAIGEALAPDEWRITMFERYTDRARRAVVLSQEVSREVRLPEIGTVALLAGLLREGEGIAFQVLQKLGVTELAVIDQLPRGSLEPPGPLPFTTQAKRALEAGLREALQLGHTYIGTEHLLLGLLREDGDVSHALREIASVTREQARQAVIEFLGELLPKPAPAPEVTPERLLTASEHRLFAERALRGHDLGRAEVHALLALVALALDSPPSDG